MTPPRTVRLLVCGAADRGDEGAALAAVATLLPALPAALLARLEVRRCETLRPEDLAGVPDRMAVLVVDAAAGPPPGVVTVLPLTALGDPATSATPHSGGGGPGPGPVALAALARGRLPAGSFVGIGGHHYAFTARLSRSVRGGLPELRAAIESEIHRLVAAGASAVPNPAGRTDPVDGPRVPRLDRRPASTLGS